MEHCSVSDSFALGFIYRGERHFCVGQDEAACDSAELNPDRQKFNALAAEYVPPHEQLGPTLSGIERCSGFSGFLPKAQRCNCH